MSSLEPGPTSKTGVTVSRTVLIVGAIVLVFVLVGVGVLGGLLIGSNQGAAQSASSSPSPKPSAPPASQPKPVATPEPEIFRIGDTITTGNVTLTLNSVEVLDSIPTTSGEPLTPDPGGQLILFRTTYSNSVNQADLSCGNSDLYVQVYDSQQREMAPVFENSRIAGNPGCNDHLLQGVPAEWNFVFQSVAGAKPLAMMVTETVSWLDPVAFDIQR